MLSFLPQTSKPSFSDFYSSNYYRVLSYVRKKIANPDDAEDLTSEAFLYCYSHYDDYDPEKSSLITWLYLVVNSRIKNYYRDHISYGDFDLVCETMQDLNIDLDKGVYLEQLHEALMKAISSLPERQQNIIILRYFENRSSEDIAQILGITSGNVRVLLSRALDKLAAFSNNYWKEYKNNG